jgi:bifunctional non-homologous end joining protein LigD
MFVSDSQRKACFARLGNRFSVANADIINGTNRKDIAMLARMVEDPDRLSSLVDDSNKIVSDKYDGIRTFAVIHDDKVELFNPRREPDDYSHKFIPISQELLNDFRDHQPVILDGEIRSVSGGMDDVHDVIARLNTDDPEKLGKEDELHPAEFMVFDMIEYEDNDISGLPLEERLGLLDSSLNDGEFVKKARYAIDDKGKFISDIMEAGKEGVIFKDLSSPYEFGERSGAWSKYKRSDADTFIVYGMERGSGKNSDKMGSLLIGEMEDGKFVESGKVGSGFTDDERKRLWDKYGSSVGDKVIFPEADRFGADVRFMEIDSKGGLRHPRLERLREDLSVGEIVK